MTLRARIVQALPELLALEEHWDGLLAASPDSTPWQGFDFISLWWRHLSGEDLLRVIVVERDGKPCQILPLQLSVVASLGVLKLRTLEPIGSIMDVNRPRLALGAPDEAASECALDAIWSMRHEWHLIRIDEKLADDAEAEQLRRFALRRGFTFRQVFSHLCPYIDLSQGWEHFLANRGSKLRKNLRAAERKLEKLGPISLQDYRTSDEVATGLGIVHQLHAHSWKREKQVEHSESAAYRSFYSGWLQAMARRGRARILVMSCADTPVAATIAFMDRDTYYSAQIVHHSGYGACSPGTLLESRELEDLLRDPRHARYDMLGSFLNNKMRWTDTAQSTTQVFVLNRGLRERLFDAYFFRLKPRIRPHLLPLLRRFNADRTKN